MTYIKKLVIKGFKSFARETEIVFDRNINVIVGPNGSGKSNITDALCFVLGRLSTKSIRATKASNLIFLGNKHYKPANEAFVELTLDNSNKIFTLDSPEVIIKRIVKKNGQSVYKINNEVKTRQEVLELLAQAGIDPYGFNIILQGEIERFVKMPSEERRKVLEEVAGISIYEMRKEKSLKELERTDEKIRQINTILRERTSYLKNLENEKEQALKYKKLEESIKRYKASIVNRNIKDLEKNLEDVNKKIENKKREIEKKESHIKKIKEEIEVLNLKIKSISEKIQESSGLEQDSLLSEISFLKQEIAGMTAKKDNFENQILELDRRRKALEESIKLSENEIEKMIKEQGKNIKSELEKKKKKLEEIEEVKRKFYLLKSELSSISNQIEDKKKSNQRLKNESNFIINQIEQIEREIKIKESLDSHQKAIFSLEQSIKECEEKISILENSILENGKLSAVKLRIVEENKKIKSEVSKLDICPLCKTKITKEHVDRVIENSNIEIEKAQLELKKLEEEAKKLKEDLKILEEKRSKEISEIRIRELDKIKLKNIEDKKQQLKRNEDQIKIIESELKVLESKKKQLENNLSKINLSEEEYETLKLEINELQRSEERNLGIEISTKQRELERIKIAIKQNIRDKEEILSNIKDINDLLEEKQKICDEKEVQAEELKKKYQKMFEEKNNLQDKVRILESDLMQEQNEKRILEMDNNEAIILKAQLSAKKDSLDSELKEFGNLEFISLPVDILKEKLANAEDLLSKIGNVNLRALEVYEQVKEEYEKIKLKVEQLEKEKQEILNTIAQIDKKKKKVFVSTLEKINSLFSRNFSQLSNKGIAVLEPENEKDVFEGGIDITIKVTHGKYFDVTSLSGGEQVLVALSLIFAIQEYKPYHFYIFDEIDAALDRRNSERLAYLLRKYMKNGQYLIITHNESIISESSNFLYGVTMQDGISKVLSIEI